MPPREASAEQPSDGGSDRPFLSQGDHLMKKFTTHNVLDHLRSMNRACFRLNDMLATLYPNQSDRVDPRIQALLITQVGGMVGLALSMRPQGMNDADWEEIMRRVGARLGVDFTKAGSPPGSSPPGASLN
jgi:hypothetical protein